MLPYLFGAFTMLSVRKAADAIIVEVQDQFQNIPGLLAGEPGVKPNTKRCVDRCTMSSVREMILPGLVAVMMPHAGGAWDNSKKYIENEQPTINGEKIVKKSETHKACVVGDTVGDPFRDTSGPSLNILIKLMSVMSLTLAPIFRGDCTTWWEGVVCTAVMLVLVIIAYYYVWVKAPPRPSRWTSLLRRRRRRKAHPLPRRSTHEQPGSSLKLGFGLRAATQHSARSSRSRRI